MKQILRASIIVFTVLFLHYCNTLPEKERVDTEYYIGYCVTQAKKTLSSIAIDSLLPRSISIGEKQWQMVPFEDWTSGFWPGILWYLYETTNDSLFLNKAKYFTKLLEPVAYSKATHHDLGFMMYCSYGNGLRLTNDSGYKNILLATADSLATLFNPKVGTMLSWPGMVQKMGWPHNTIIDNMINLELLFWAGKTGNNQKLTDIAISHAEITMKNHFRKDFSSYHVIVYDSVTGEKIKGVTHQGYSDSSMWARGQAWAIYGFTMCYRETGKKEFLDFVQNLADIYIKRLPVDFVPYWDFDLPNVTGESKDASAAAITASALLELSTYIENAQKSKYYYSMAVKMLNSLNENYLSKDLNSSFLMHSVGHKPNNSEIDVSIIYADYYYLEALMRLKKIDSNQELYSTNR